MYASQVQNHNERAVEPCRFHLQGRCMYDRSCKLSHEPVSDAVAIRVLSRLPVSSPAASEDQQARSCAYQDEIEGGNGAVSGLRAGAQDFVPAFNAALRMRQYLTRIENPFRPTAGLGAVEEEEAPGPNPAGDIFDQAIAELENGSDNKKGDDDININDSEITRDYDGTIVAFQTGLEVSSIELPADFSTLQIADLPREANAEAVAGLLENMGYPTPETCIRITMGGEKSAATVQVNDSAFAQNVTDTFKYAVGGAAHPGEMAMYPVAKEETTGYLGSRIYKNSVSCNWSSPSWHADEALCETVKKMLEQNGGQVDWFQHHPGTQSARATFSTRESAEKAIRNLHNTSPRMLSLIGKGKLYISQIICVRYNLPKRTFNALKSALDALAPVFQSNGVRIKIQCQAQKPLASISITGEALNHVVGAKSKVDTLLQGNIVCDGESALWDPYFESDEALHHLARLWGTHKVYVHRESSKNLLLMYGGSTTQQAAVTAELVSRVRWLKPQVYQLVLNRAMLGIAMNGGMLRVNQQVDPSAKLEVSPSHQPMMALTDTTASKFQDAVEMLLGPAYKKVTDNEQECVLCLESPEQPLRMSCGHIYCTDCFQHQCNSAFSVGVASTFSVIDCIGNDHNCEHTFTLPELRDMLASVTFERLLRSSFDLYISANYSRLRYCPTPDCTHIYRPTTTGAVVTCSRCLQAICTTCHTRSHAVVHAGMTCREVQDLGAGGTLALQKWKAEFGAKDCPKCGTLITKADGCDHIQCLGCKVHICWACMRLFEDTEEFDGGNEIYDHMESAHPLRPAYEEEDDFIE